MKKVAVLIVLLVLAVALAGCGGGSSAPTESSGTPSAGEASGTPAAAGGAASAPAPEKKNLPRPFVTQPNTPEFFVEALKKNEPLFVLFYSDDEISEDVALEVNKVYEDKNYQGAAQFLLLKMDEGSEVTKLARDFSIGYVPYVAVLNRQETIVFERSGYVDSKVLEQALYDAINK